MGKWDKDYQNDEEYDANFFDDVIDDEESPESEQRLINKLDDELIEYFSDARIIIKKTLKKNKKKKEKVIYTIGQTVNIGTKKGIIIYGPYEVDGKSMYEIEIDDNGVISVEEKYINRN